MSADREGEELRAEEPPEAPPARQGRARSPSARARAEALEEVQNRPYRRFVRILFFVAIIAITVLVLRGIIRHLDRLPSVDQLYKPDVVDVRALRACGEDLERLETQLLQSASRVFALLPSDQAPGEDLWEPVAKELELERLTVVARCRLDEPSADPVVADLEAAANALEELARSFTLLYARHKKEGVGYEIEFRSAMQRATNALKSR